VSFSGNNAAIFYDLLKQGDLNWSIFDLSKKTIGRLDINYVENFPDFKREETLEQFIKNTCQKIKYQSIRNCVDWKQNKRGIILRIGARSSSHFYRVYSIDKDIKFELELKKKSSNNFKNCYF
jgi:hypothetical protein